MKNCLPLLDGLRIHFLVGIMLIAIQGCATAPPRNNPIPEELAGEAQVPGIPDARTLGDEAAELVDYWLNTPDEAVEAEFGGIMDRQHIYLAISGGGDNGAFGAGLLNGWTESGTRPEFTMVTAIRPARRPDTNAHAR